MAIGWCLAWYLRKLLLHPVCEVVWMCLSTWSLHSSAVSKGGRTFRRLEEVGHWGREMKVIRPLGLIAAPSCLFLLPDYRCSVTSQPLPPGFPRHGGQHQPPKLLLCQFCCSNRKWNEFSWVDTIYPISGNLNRVKGKPPPPLGVGCFNLNSPCL